MLIEVRNIKRDNSTAAVKSEINNYSYLAIVECVSLTINYSDAIVAIAGL